MLKIVLRVQNAISEYNRYRVNLVEARLIEENESILVIILMAHFARPAATTITMRTCRCC